MQHGASLSGHRQEANGGQQRIAREQQNQAAIFAQPAISPLLGRERAPLDPHAGQPARIAHHRQEGNRCRTRRDARTRRRKLKELPCERKSSSNPPPARVISTLPPRTSAPCRKRSKSGNTILRHVNT